MKKFGEFVLKYKWWVFLAIVLTTILMILGFRYITIDSDFSHSYPPDDPMVKLFNYAGEKFGSNYIAIVGLETKNIFNYKTLMRIKTLTDRFKTIKGVSNVTSIINVMDIRKTPDGIEVKDLFPEIPKDPKKLKAKKKYILSREMYKGKIVSADGTSTIIMVRIRDNVDKNKVAHQIYKIVKEVPGPEKIFYSGYPLIMEYTARMIQKDMKTLGPITFLVVMIILYLSFSSVRGVLLTQGVVLVAIIWVFGLMGLVHKPIGIISNSLPVILLATGTAYGIHLLNKYNEEINKTPDKRKALLNSIATTGIPIIMAALTTFVGFISMLSASLLTVKDFGLFASIGIIFSLILTMLIVPPVLELLPIPKKRKSGGHAPLVLEKTLEKIGKYVLTHEKLIVITGIIIVLISIISLPKLTTDVNMLNYYPKNSPPRLAEKFMEKKFGGSTTYGILFKSRNGIKNPAILRTIYDLEKELKVTPHSKNPQSIADLVAELNYNMNGIKGIPDTEEKIAQLWFFIEGNSAINQMVTPDNKNALLQGFIDNMDTKYISEVVTALENDINNMPKNFYKISPEQIIKLPENQRVKLINWKLDEIKNNLTWDISYFQRNYRNLNLVLPSQKFFEELRKYLLNPSLYPPEATKEIKKDILAYLNSDEVEVTLKPDQQQKVLKLMPLIISQNEDQLANKLIKLFPDKNKYDLSDLADSLIGVFQNNLDAYRIKHFTDKISWFKKLSDEDKATIKGDLSMINDSVWFIPAKIATAAALKDTEEKVHLFAGQAGTAQIMEKIRKDLTINMASSVGIAIFLVFILLSIQLKSLVGGIFSLTAIVFTIMVNFLIMVLFHISIDTATVIFGSIAVGIGIDYTIHFITRLKEEVKSGESIEKAIENTMSTTGVAIFINSLTVALGFLVLTFSAMEPLRMLGLLVALTMVWSALGAITLYPSVVLGLKLKFLKK